jgi:hypothetical protein
LRDRADGAVRDLTANPDNSGDFGGGLGFPPATLIARANCGDFGGGIGLVPAPTVADIARAKAGDFGGRAGLTPGTGFAKGTISGTP